MSDAATTPPTSPPTPSTTTTTLASAPPGVAPGPLQVTVISHSGFYYWWPIWAFGFLFAILTWFNGHRMAIVPHDAVLQSFKDESKIEFKGKYNRLAEETEPLAGKDGDDFASFHLKTRVSSQPWMGPLFLCILFAVMLITNIPLRGLWSLVTIITFVLLAVLFSLFHLWDAILGRFADLHIYINMAGFVFISFLTLMAWVFTVFFFDKRSYIIFTAGQIKVCEEIGTREKVYDTTGLTLEKQRDDWFRHIILGFGSGDLTVKTSGADRQAITMPNVAFIGFKIGAIERLMRQRQVKS